MKASVRILSFAMVMAAGATISAYASTISGIVRTPAGRPAPDVFVTAHNADRKMSVTVLSGADGHYRLDHLFPGTYDVRARKAGFADDSVDSVRLTELDVKVNLRLLPDNAEHLSTPGSAWLNALPNSPMKAAFITSCTICHDIGSPLSRGPRDAAAWRRIIHQMRTQADVYSVIIKTMNDAALAKWLADQRFGASFVPFDAFAHSAHVVLSARISEYDVGDITSWAHDMAVEPRTGTLWVGDYVDDQLISIDPHTGAQKSYPCPVHGAGMHTLAFDRDGSLWITFQLADMVGRFDPRTDQWRIYGGFTKDSLLHSFALDSLGYVKKDARGRIYMTQFGSNQIARLNPVTGKVKEYTLPGGLRGGHPYGIAMDSVGRVWFSKYSENLIGYLNPANGRSKDWPLPRPDSGPHRMHIDNSDNLWIPLSGYGTILRYNTRDGASKVYRLPDADTFPYVTRYDEKSNRVWITGDGANSIYALDQKSGRFTTFRLPSRFSYGRTISIDYTTGDVCTALSSYPNKLALRNHGILLCIDDALSLVKRSGGGR